MCQSLLVHAELRRDPTKTKGVRNRYSADMYRRFRKLKGRIRKEIIEMDGFGLRVNQGRFEFTRSSEKVSAFMDWLRQAQREEILDISRGATSEQAASRSWQNVYIQTAYNSGLLQAANQMRKGGVTIEDSWINAAFNRPIHADRVGIAYTRAFQELQGITEVMDQQISRELARGIAEGEGPEAIARRINNRVDKVGISRARVLAQTEVINSHAEASLNGYQEAGIEGVEVLAEFATAGDSRVCPECEALENEVKADGGWTLQRARGVIPVHPRCRCAWIPQVKNGTGITLS